MGLVHAGTAVPVPVRRVSADLSVGYLYIKRLQGQGTQWPLHVAPSTAVEHHCKAWGGWQTCKPESIHAQPSAHAL